MMLRDRWKVFLITQRPATARATAGALDILEQTTTAQLQPSLLGRIASLVGWR